MAEMKLSLERNVSNLLDPASVQKPLMMTKVERIGRKDRQQEF